MNISERNIKQSRSKHPIHNFNLLFFPHKSQTETERNNSVSWTESQQHLVYYYLDYQNSKNSCTRTNTNCKTSLYNHYKTSLLKSCKLKRRISTYCEDSHIYLTVLLLRRGPRAPLMLWAFGNVVSGPLRVGTGYHHKSCQYGAWLREPIRLKSISKVKKISKQL